MNSNKKPNILWIVVDCLRNDRCSTEDNPLSLKAWPKLCENGVSFTQALSSASTTSPSFSSMLTSLYHFSHGVYSVKGPPISPNITTITEIMSQQGYDTNCFMTGPLMQSIGLTRGFDNYQFRARNETIYNQWGKNLFSSFKEIAKQEKPWFAMMHFFEIHRPLQVPPEVQLPKNADKQFDVAWQHLDQKIDELLSLVPEDTIIVFTADHGEILTRRSDNTIFQHGLRKIRKSLGYPYRHIDWRYHGFFPYDELHLVPLCISGPGLPKNFTLNQQVRHIDIMPTLLDFLGMTLPENIHGRSLVPMINGQKMSKEAAYLYTGRNDATRYWHAVRTETHKLIVPAGPLYNNNTIFLFDLENDPNEKNNIAVDATGPVCDLRIKLDSILAKKNITATDDISAVTTQEFSEEDKVELEEKLKDLGYL